MKLEKVVVAVDFHSSSLAAARWTAQHLLPDAEVVLVHCLELPPPSSMLWESLPPAEELVPRLHEAAEGKLAELLAEIRDGRGRCVVRKGHASEEVASVASDLSADLVVAGRHGGHHGVFHVLGGTAEQLVAACHRPVLLARSLPSRAPGTLLVPVDESRAAGLALEWAAALGARHGSRLVAHHSVTEWYYQRVRELDTEAAAKKAQEGVESRARQWVEDFVDEHVRGVEVVPHVSSGQPGFQVLAAIERFCADLVVVGSHGLASLIGDPLARLSRFLILSAPCSVFVVPFEGEDPARG